MIKEVLPPSLKQDENITKLVDVFDASFVESHEAVRNVLIYSRIDELPEEVLDLLGWQFHIEGYEFAQDIKAKRSLIKAFVELHRLKGTPAGIKKSAELSGSKVLRLLEAPAKFFLAPVMTKEEKNFYYRQFPQIRIYPKRKRSQKQGTIFWKDYFRKTYPLKTDAIVRSMLRITLVKNNREIELITSSWDTKTTEKQAVVDIYIPGKAGFASFCNKINQYLTKTDASCRAISVKEIHPYIEERRTLRIDTIPLSAFKFVKADAEYTAEEGKARSCFLNSAENFFLAQTDAVERIYYKLYVWNPDIILSRTLSPNHLDVSRLSMPHHTAEVTVDLVRKGKGLQFIGNTLMKTDKTYIWKTLNLMKQYNRASVHVYVDTKKYIPIKASSVIYANKNYIAGQYKEVA